MRKYLVALLSITGLAGFGVPLKSQVLKGGKVEAQSQAQTDKAKGDVKKNGGKDSNLKVKQQTVREQNQPNADNKALTKAKDKELTKAKSGK